MLTTLTLFTGFISLMFVGLLVMAVKEMNREAIDQLGDARRRSAF